MLVGTRWKSVRSANRLGRGADSALHGRVPWQCNVGTRMQLPRRRKRAVKLNARSVLFCSPPFQVGARNAKEGILRPEMQSMPRTDESLWASMLKEAGCPICACWTAKPHKRGVSCELCELLGDVLDWREPNALMLLWPGYLGH